MITEVRKIAPGEPDWPAFTASLAAEGLPVSDLSHPGQSFFAFRDVAGLAAYGGFAVKGPEGLIRSVVVRKGRQRGGLGSEVAAWLLARLKGEGAARAWLLTNTAADFFERQGFDRMDRAAAPAAIRETSEFAELCPQDAVLMRRELD